MLSIYSFCGLLAAIPLLSTSLTATDAPIRLESGPPKSSQSFRVFQLNVWNEAVSIEAGLDKIVDAIIASNADIITLSEVRNSKGDFHQRLLSALSAKGQSFFGQYAGGDVGLLSKFPITSKQVVFPLANDQGSISAWSLTLPNQSTISVCSAHLDWKNYAIYLPRGYDGHSWKMIDANHDGTPDPVTDPQTLHAYDQKSKRDEAIAAFIQFAKSLPPQTPCLLLGDFNECSHLDWTQATANHYSHNGVVIEWKNSTTLAKAGFADAWRTLYPNPITHPGATWPSEAFGKKSTSWAPKVDERDRIDFVYFNPSSNIKPLKAWVAGSPVLYSFSNPTTDTTQTPYALTKIPWPSDHKGVIVDFSLPNSH